MITRPRGRGALTLIAWAVTAVWVGNFIAGLVASHYTPPESINLVFSSIVGALLLQDRPRKRR